VDDEAPAGDRPEAPARPTFDEVYRGGVAGVLRVLRHHGVVERDCEDAVHEVFLVVLRRLPEYETWRPLKAWLHGIARVVAMNRRKRQDRTPFTTDVPGLEREQAKMAHETGLDQESRAILRDLLLRLLDSIEPRRRDVFVMHELEEMQIPEIAEELGIPEGTAASRLQRARADVEAALKRLKASQRGGAVLGSLSVAMLIDAERVIPPLPPGMSDRVLARLQAARGAPGPSPSPRNASPLARIPPLARGALLFAAGVAVGALWSPHRPSPPPSSPMPSATVAPIPPETTSPVPTAAASASADLAPDAGPAPRALDDEAEERALMRKASGALAAGDAAGALAAVEEHARRFRGGRHVEEREGHWILALVRAGRGAEARERFERFARSYPASGRLDALRGALDDGAGSR
jgi:RNA polymerase sigma factor (sigma-70 family)